MWLPRSDRALILLFILFGLQTGAQEIIHSVTMEKLNSGLYKVQYGLNSPSGLQVQTATLKIFRRRAGAIEEVYSGDMGPQALPGNRPDTYVFNWKPAQGMVKAGDELQAKLILTYQAVASQKTAPGNQMPLADAGRLPEVQLPVNHLIALDGTSSRDPDGRLVSAQWKQISGPTDLTIIKKDSLLAYLGGDFREGTYAFELSVRDERGAVAISRTLLHVKPAPATASVPTPINNSKAKRDYNLPPATVKSKPELKGGPSNAALDLLLPGLGHYFVSGDYKGNNRKAASFLLTALYAGSVGGAFYFQGQSNSDYKKYTDLASYREYQKDANGVIIGVRGTRETEANAYLAKARSMHRNALICLGVGGGILAGDLVYTFLRGTRNKKEWKESTAFEPRLFISSNGSTASAGIQIKF